MQNVLLYSDLAWGDPGGARASLERLYYTVVKLRYKHFRAGANLISHWHVQGILEKSRWGDEKEVGKNNTLFGFFGLIKLQH